MIKKDLKLLKKFNNFNKIEINKLFLIHHERSKMMVYTTLKITEMSQKIITINWYDAKD